MSVAKKTKWSTKCAYWNKAQIFIDVCTYVFFWYILKYIVTQCFLLVSHGKLTVWHMSVEFRQMLKLQSYRFYFHQTAERVLSHWKYLFSKYIKFSTARRYCASSWYTIVRFVFSLQQMSIGLMDNQRVYFTEK